ncbi:MAG: endonuclease/exonuclease/phosphatase family protein [Planctomycetota bacterium]
MISKQLAAVLVAVVLAEARADPPVVAEGAIRVAAYNVAMYREKLGDLAEELRSGTSEQAVRIAEVIRRVRPDVLLLCEIDYDPANNPPALFADRYLAAGDGAAPPIEYPHRFTAPVNTGVPSGLDLDGDGATDGPADGWGYGAYPGQYGMAVLSRLPIDAEASRTFQELRWSNLPDAWRPVWPDSGDAFYDDATWRAMRLPSKSFWDVVVRTTGGEALHLIGSHPTPPVFDGPEDRNGTRNADEVRLVREYVEGGLAEYFVDDRGRVGPLRPGEAFVVLGDLNADPHDGGGNRSAISRLIRSDALAADPRPRSPGALAARRDGFRAEVAKKGDPALATCDGGLRIDYALPSANLRVLASGVYWPAPGEPGAEAVNASDHRLVWVDVAR